MFYQIFLSQKVKKCEIITYKEDIFELSHELPNNIRPTSWEIIIYQETVQTSKNDSLGPRLPTKIKMFLILAKEIFKNRN